MFPSCNYGPRILLAGYGYVLTMCTFRCMSVFIFNQKQTYLICLRICVFSFGDVFTTSFTFVDRRVPIVKIDKYLGKPQRRYLLQTHI